MRSRWLTVEWRDGGEWIPAVREDLLDRVTDDSRALPPATFRTPQAALRFIARMRGMVHCGTLPVWRIGTFTEQR